jgi:hypothetical protein
VAHRRVIPSSPLTARRFTVLSPPSKPTFTMATNNLDTTLQKEGITSNQLAARCGLSKSTVKSVFMKKRTVAPSTQARLVLTLNNLSKSKKDYTVEDIFPVKVFTHQRPAFRKPDAAA